MSDQTTIHEVDCLCTDDRLEASLKECLEKYQAYSSPRGFQVLEDFPLGGCAEAMEGKEKENKDKRLLDFLRELLAILFPLHSRSLDIGEQGHDSLPLILHKSNGGYIQPMIWKPGGIHRNE